MKPEEVPYFIPGTWNPATMPSPWPYTRAQATMVVKRYKLASQLGESL